MLHQKSAFNDRTIVYSQGSELKPLESYDRYYIRADITVDSPAAKTFAASDVNTTSDAISETSHPYSTGQVGQLTTDGSLPTGLSLATDYYIIKVDADSYKLATSLSNAQAGTAIDLTDQGSGNHTFTPNSLAGASIKLQASDLDNPAEADWIDVSDTSQTITTSDVCSWNVSKASYHKVRYYVTLTGGQISVSANFNGKGY